MIAATAWIQLCNVSTVYSILLSMPCVYSILLSMPCVYSILLSMPCVHSILLSMPFVHSILLGMPCVHIILQHTSTIWGALLFASTVPVQQVSLKGHNWFSVCIRLCTTWQYDGYILYKVHCTVLCLSMSICCRYVCVCVFMNQILAQIEPSCSPSPLV